MRETQSTFIDNQNQITSMQSKMNFIHQKLIDENQAAYDNFVALSFKYNTPRTVEVKKEITQL